MSVEASRARGFTERSIFAVVPVLYRSADCVTAVSRDCAVDLQHFFGFQAHPVEFIYNPFELELIRKRAEETVSHPWFEPGQPPVVLAIGRLNQAKDYPTLIRAFSKLRANRDVRLMILGEGELRIDLEGIVAECGLGAEQVQLPGFVSNPFAYLARCAVFALSSHYEGLPGALIEAMACGTPVVSTDCPSGPREILEDGRWGSLVPVGDEDALAEAIDTVLSTPQASLPDVRGRAEDFGLPQAVDKYLNVLNLPLEQKCAT